MAVEQWPVAEFIQEEIDFRGMPLQSFLDVTGIAAERWKHLLAGENGMLLSECERIGNVLGINPQFLSNLNLSYKQWQRNQS